MQLTFVYTVASSSNLNHCMRIIDLRIATELVTAKICY